LYEAQQADVLAYFMRRLGRDDAIEATADVFLTAWRRIEDVPAGPEGRMWIFGIARNVLRNRERTNRRSRRLRSRIAAMPAGAEPSPETVVLRRAQDREILEALALLRPLDREILQLRLWEEAGYDEIAAVLGCSRHAAEQRYGKALRRLRSVCRRAGHVSVSGTATTHPSPGATREA
jgi:RNA polymerase sigma-70 factor (ECF subfamily)